MNCQDHAELMLKKGLALLSSGKRGEAISFLENAIEIDNRNFSAMHQLAMLLAEDGEHTKALELYKKIIGIIPDNTDAWLLLGVEYAETGDFQEAIRCFRHCIAHSKENAGLHKMLGIALAEINSHEEALEQYTTALSLAPGDSDILTHLAIEQIHFLKMGEAEQNLLKAIAIDPLNALAYNNLARAYKFEGRADEAESAFRKALEIEPENHVLIDNLLLTMNYLPGLDPLQVAREHIELSARVYRKSRGNIPQNRRQGDKLRVGYISGDFHDHSVAYFFEPVLFNHDRKKFDIFCYSNDTREDETTKRLKSCNATWRQIAKISDEAAAKLVADDCIDILIDLSGHSSENRLGILALKPAPVQISWIGYPHSTGMPEIDYYITDKFCDPPGMTEHLYTEKLLRLPRIFSCYLPPLEFPPVAPPPHRETGFITFGSFNNFAKVNKELIRLWSTVLCNTPDSRLLLKSMALGDTATRGRVLHQFEKSGVAADRIAMLNSVSSSLEHLALYGQIDIALDTFPYHGTTTTCEALWMGVPVLTLAGGNHVSRVGVTLLANAGTPELVASSPEEYVSKASALAADRSRLHYYRENLRTMLAHSPVMDAPGVTRELEQLLVKTTLGKS